MTDIVRSFVGTKFHYKGRSKGGIDCAGLYVKVIQELIDPTYNYLNYSINIRTQEILKELEKYCIRIDKIEKEAILVVRLGNEIHPQHIAFYTNENSIIHTYYRKRKAIEENYTDYWKNRTYYIYKVK